MGREEERVFAVGDLLIPPSSRKLTARARSCRKFVLSSRYPIIDITNQYGRFSMERCKNIECTLCSISHGKTGYINSKTKRRTVRLSHFVSLWILFFSKRVSIFPIFHFFNFAFLLFFFHFCLLRHVCFYNTYVFFTRTFVWLCYVFSEWSNVGGIK